MVLTDPANSNILFFRCLKYDNEAFVEGIYNKTTRKLSLWKTIEDIYPTRVVTMPEHSVKAMLIAMTKDRKLIRIQSVSVERLEEIEALYERMMKDEDVRKIQVVL